MRVVADQAGPGATAWSARLAAGSYADTACQHTQQHLDVGAGQSWQRLAGRAQLSRSFAETRLTGVIVTKLERLG